MFGSVTTCDWKVKCAICITFLGLLLPSHLSKIFHPGCPASPYVWQLETSVSSCPPFAMPLTAENLHAMHTNQQITWIKTSGLCTCILGTHHWCPSFHQYNADVPFPTAGIRRMSSSFIIIVICGKWRKFRKFDAWKENLTTTTTTTTTTTAAVSAMVWACVAKRRQWLGVDMYGAWSRGFQTKT